MIRLASPSFSSHSIPSRLVSSLAAAHLRAAVLGVALVVPVTLLSPSVVQAQEQADPLVKAVEDFWHYGKIARYDLAAQQAQQIVGNDPLKVLGAFEKVAGQRDDNIDVWMTRFQGVDELKDIAGQIAKLINEGRYTRRADPATILRNIDRLDDGSLAFGNAMVQLRESGELAIPLMLETLKDPAKQSLHGPVRRAIVDLGRLALNPLVAATESSDAEQLIVLSQLLGDIGYDSAIPYLVRLTETSDKETVKQAAKAAIDRLGGAQAGAADLFYDLGEKLYYEKSSLTADRRFPTANVWTFEQGKGLLRTPVPQEIFNDVMAMRATEYALALNTPKDALSLWLAANYKREADLPQGATDTTRAQGQPDAHFYGVTAGAQYVNRTLARALQDGNSPVALKAVKSLQDIVGDSNFKSGGTESGPLIEAMQYGDRRVRFEAAFTLAQALPQSGFVGQDNVVPLLAEAISQTGQPSVLVVMPSQAQVNAVVEPLKAEQYIAAGATNASDALSAAASVPAIDVVVISDELEPAEIENLLGLMSQNPKLRGAAKLIVVKSTASAWEERKVSDKTISTSTATDAAGLKPAITEAREKTGLPLDPQLATEYATRSGELLKRLAISRGQVLDLTPARPTLLGALEDARPEIVKLSGEALALMNSEDAQRGLLIRATTEGVSDDVKVSLFDSLATSAKFWGNQLTAAQIESLDAVVRDTANPDVKTAAAQARGALNLPNDQAKVLILDQSRR